MIGKLIGVLDVIPGWKVNLGASGIVISYVLGVLGVPAIFLEPTKDFFLAVITYGLAMKVARAVK